MCVQANTVEISLKINKINIYLTVQYNLRHIHKNTLTNLADDLKNS